MANRLRAHFGLDSLRRPSPATLAALAVFAVAFAARLVWVWQVDSPFDNVFSDMGGYVNRALQAAYGKGDPYPIFATLYPPGTHLVYAAEMKLVGWTHHGPMLLLNCTWGAVVAPCTMLLALRIVPRLAVAVPVGLAMALWYPVLAFSGFFSSEQPYAGALALSAWLLVRQVESGKSAVALGLTSSIAYLVRPQIILTLAALAVVGLHALRRGSPRLHVGRLVLAGAILTSAVVFGAVRYHALCGRWGLISDNAAMTRLWADTDYGKVRATWHSPDGRNLEFFFGSPPKNAIGEHRELYFQGYVGDPVLLDRARRAEVLHMSAGDRVIRWVKNVRLLFVDNPLWPASDHEGTGWRRISAEASKDVLLAFICPLALLGIVSGVRRPTTVLVVCTAHVVTALIVAAFFFAETRYRVPYDMFLVLLALEGSRYAVRGLRWLDRIRPVRSTLAALGVFAVALAVRLVWVSLVDSPFDNIFSDMAGYINRALQAANGAGYPVTGSLGADPRTVAAAAAGVDPWTFQCPLYPPGTHLVYAAEMRLVGWSHHAAMLVLNCTWGAVVAPCTMLLALRIVPRLSVAVPVGLAMAFWYPLLAFSGFFSSEQPYAGAIALSAWLLVRQVEHGKSAVALALASSVAYLVRPQIVLTLGALSLVGLFILWRRPPRPPRLRASRVLLAGVLFTATVAWGATRYHQLSGRWGLISDNGTMTRLWADTDYGRVHATWHTPDGQPVDFLFESPPKAELGMHRQLDFDGYIGDPVQLDRARRGEVNYMSAGERAIRWVKNVRLLFVDSTLWPASTHEGTGWRRISAEASKSVLLLSICPLALLGIVSCLRRPATVLVICTAHVVTALIVAAFFFAEARYRVPYDMFLVLLALEGGCSLWLRRRRPRAQGQPLAQVK